MPITFDFLSTLNNAKPTTDMEFNKMLGFFSALHYKILMLDHLKIESNLTTINFSAKTDH